MPELPDAFRAEARFFVDVRRGELYLRSADRSGLPDNRRRGAEIVADARERARRDGVYGGSYRVLAMVLLWQSLPEEEFAVLLDGAPGPGDDGETERGFLLRDDLETTVLGEAAYLHVPVRVLRSELRLGTEEERRGILELRRLAADLAGQPDLERWRQMALHRLADHFLRQHAYERALVYIEQLPESETLYPRGWIALERGDHRLAEEIGLRLVSERGDDRFYQLVGDARELEGRYAEALDAYERALAAARWAQDRVAARNGSGDALLGLGRLDEAEARYRAVLEDLEPLGDALVAAAARAETTKDLGRLAEAHGQERAAYELFRASLRDLEDARRGVSLDLFGGSWLAQHGDQLTAVDGMLRGAAAVAADPYELLSAMERLKARSLLDYLAGGVRNVDPAVRRAIQRLASARDPDQVDAGLRELESRRSELGLAGPGGEPMEADALRAWWIEQSGVLVLCYWLGEDRAWLLHGIGGGSTGPQLVDLGTAAQAGAHLRDAHEAVSDPESVPGPALAAAAAFFLPGTVDLDGIRRILVSPDTRLARLPFAALPRAGVPLGISHALVRAPSLSVAAELAGRPPRPAGVLVLDSVQAPALEAEFDLDPLRFSEREGDLVVRAHPEARRLRGAEASLMRMGRALVDHRPGLVHLSAHAVGDARIPSQSLLLLADGLVSMGSLASLQLRDATIVFSACSSALGADRGREGFVGLPEGVLGSGARSVVAPLWNVNQQATADLMGQFHHFLAAGLDEPRALSEARARLAARDTYAHPYYWAGFSVFGPPGSPVVSGTARGWVPLGSAALVLALLGLGWRSAAARRRERQQGVGG